MIDNFATQRFCSLFNLPPTGRYRFFEADVLKDNLSQMFDSSDVVVHLVAATNTAGIFEIRKLIEQVNHNGSEIVARACLKNDCAMIFISTTSVYGTQDEKVDEDSSISDLKPQSLMQNLN
ncbi:MAG: NAD-dependent epimerase/dehydratase family protein [Desulfobacterales bacterium]|jgi:nucleoside-diphosphate-sugar epimerase|nr:NAD-dependent epimerase/dehydratase family protein [Desulfobacterales bacterium]